MGFSDDKHAHRRKNKRFPVPYLNGTMSCALDGLKRKWFVVQYEQSPYLQPRQKFWTGSWQNSQSLIRWAWVELAMVVSKWLTCLSKKWFRRKNIVVIQITNITHRQHEKCSSLDQKSKSTDCYQWNIFSLLDQN